MTMATDGPLVLWSYALAALLFGALALDEARRPAGGWTGRMFVAALVLTVLWALAIAGIGDRDVSAGVAEALRNIGWLIFMFLLVRRDRSGNAALASVYVVVIALAGLGGMCAVVEAVPLGRQTLLAIDAARLVFRMMTAVSALVLVQHLQHGARSAGRLHARLVAFALAVMWGADLLLNLAAWASGGWPVSLVVTRGAAMVGAALALWIATRHRGDGALGLSRTIAIRSLAAVAVIVYAGSTVLLTMFAGYFAGGYARASQAAIVVGATAALLALFSTPWLRAWTRVKVAKHLFRHRYDYRVEWQRFADTLGRQGGGAAPLDARIVKAIADIVHAPAGLMLVPDGAGLGCGASWHWSGDPDGGAGEALVRHLVTTARIVEFGPIRAGDAPKEEADAIPEWMIAVPGAWALVPLIHGETLVAAILLVQPPVGRALDWEDFDLLRVAGRQAASYLAEERAHLALADASRFDEFNRRFAFIMHDIKNLASQLTLVARNAERHAQNPDFRADMVATLNESAERMTVLLARLSQHSGQRAEPLQPVDITALMIRVANSRRMQHPMALALGVVPLASAQAGKLEQVIDHLVQNAIEASIPDAAVTLATGMSADRITIEVADRGCGMSPAFIRDQLFRPFVSSKPGGFGIGAFEARQLVHAMGGTIAVTSREGEGTRFTILLPVAAALEQAA
ncbi:XrtA/PEP-CTERM system histidine kinase PrsK [uncultured Sphingomonas sp.]|uniref:XrtA/PEP-CTERM system histidine kinase PrsK n=1 Tax=uncultured Sphingomonas sp. TaxID=158754 RepID=UPI0035CB082B